MRNILIIDHNPHNIDFLRQKLINDFGCAVTVLSQGQEALESPQDYELIFIADQLPEISGTQFIKQFHEKYPESKSLLILIFNQKDDEKDAQEAFKAGVYDILQISSGEVKTHTRLRNFLDFAKATRELNTQNERIEHAVQSATYELRHFQERYLRATEAAKDGIWDWSIRKGQIFYSQTWCQMLGFEKEEVPSIPLFWTNRVHHDDLFLFTAAFDNYINGKTNSLEVEYRIRNRGGEYLWVKVMGIAVFDPETNHIERLVGVQRDISAVKEVQMQLLYNALHDNLTKLPNRTLFTERLNQAFLRFKRYPNEQFAVVFFDLDKFKDVNDVYGHAAGDKVLKHVAKLLRGCVREIDTVARLGGDEFVVLADQISDKKDIIQMIERVFEEAKHPILIGDDKIYPLFSIGLSLSKESHTSANKALREADIALYQAKEKGRNQYVIFDPKVHNTTPRKVEMISSLSSALNNKEIFVYYQPIVDIKAQKIWGYEALLRWHHPTLGLVSPVDFIPLAEETDMIVHLGDFALRSAFEQLSKWRKDSKNNGLSGFGDTHISINMTAHQVLVPNFLESILSLVAFHDLRPQNIVFEFSEYNLSEIIKKNHSILVELRRRNFEIALDDFGEGKASVRSLVDFPLSVLKVDRSLILDIENDAKKRKLFNLVLKIGMESKLNMIIEGVQNKHMLDLVKNGGGSLIQGFYFSSPQLPKDLLSEVELLERLTKCA